MASFLERLETLASRIISSPYPTPTLLKVPPSKYRPEGRIGLQVPKDAGYFSVRVHELFLKDGRTLWDTYDPMLVAITEFLYDGKKLSVPFVISSEMFKQRSDATPHALLFNDILVAGPHPFRGGNIALSLALYKVKRENFAKKTLKLVEGLSSVVGIPADTELLAKIGNTFIDGLEALIDLDDTVPLFGNRIEIDTTSVTGLSSACWLLTPTSSIRDREMLVEDGRLSVRSNSGSLTKYEGQDYILYSLLGYSRRADESSLPFYSLRQQALDAVLTGEEGWKRAKAILLTLYQQMITSPDLTMDEASELFERFKGELLRARDVLQRTTEMSRSAPRVSTQTQRLNSATGLLDLN